MVVAAPAGTMADQVETRHPAADRLTGQAGPAAALEDLAAVAVGTVAEVVAEAAVDPAAAAVAADALDN